MGTPARWWEDHFFLFFFYPHRKWLGERRGQEESLLRQGDSIAWAQTGGQDLPTSDPCRFRPQTGLHPLARPGKDCACSVFLWVSQNINHVGRRAPAHLTDEAAEAQSGEVTGSSGGVGPMVSLLGVPWSLQAGRGIWETQSMGENDLSFVDIRGVGKSQAIRRLAEILSFQNEPHFLYTPDSASAAPSSRNPSLHWLTSTDPSSQFRCCLLQGAFPRSSTPCCGLPTASWASPASARITCYAVCVSQQQTWSSLRVRSGALLAFNIHIHYPAWSGV